MQNSSVDHSDRSVVDRTLKIFGCFNVRNTALTVSEISRSSGLPVATTYRLVSKLLSWGALERAAGNKYSIGLRLWEVASLAPRHSMSRTAALPHMLELQKETNSSVFLSAREEGDGIWLESFWGDGVPYDGSCIVGNRFPLYASASGQVLLAHADPAVQGELYSRGTRAVTGRTVAGSLPLRKLVNDVKRRGYAVDDCEPCDDLSGVAAPIHGGCGSVVACVALCGSSADGSPHQRVKPLLATARRISRELAKLQGARPPSQRRGLDHRGS
ncbi:IclR family transcriptional regulator [Streptomyces bathyalis]|uniref:IclR family transcriptional regulator n=1 Tax=Streptomyces bathyalis TaxID=2710756 RepID=A0A7T1T9X9_9ACTN|nr:IclR family transcriptional regulator [Streptomyces bathyalis]QPP09118.1 IclR family transcriptional regulator [Streptomyces bathyalis]